MALGAYAMFAVVLFARTWLHPTTRLIGSPGDTSLFVWYLRWVPWAILHGHNPFFSGYVNAPHGINLMWNTAMPVLGVLMAPVTAVFGAVFAYNLLATVSVALSGWTAALALRRILGWDAGAWAGGLVFAFSPFLVAQSLGHLQLTSAYLFPVFVLLAHEALVTQRWPVRRLGVAVGALAAAQLLIGEELLALTAVALAAGAVVLAVVYRDEVAQRVHYAARTVAWGAGTFLVLAGVPVMFQFFGPQSVHGPVQPRDLYVADLWGPFVPTSAQLIHPLASVAGRFQSRGAEACAYLGVTLLVLIIVQVVRNRRSRAVVAAAVTMGLLFVLALGPHLHAGGHKTAVPLPWSVVGSIPPLESLLPVRLLIAIDFIAAGFVGMAVEAAWSARRLAALGGIAVALVPMLPRMPFPTTGADVPAFFTSRALDMVPKGSLAVVAPYPEPRNFDTLRWQEASGFRFAMPGGYAVAPGDFGEPSFTGPDTTLHDVLAAIQDGASLRAIDVATFVAVENELRSLDVSTVLVGPMPNRRQAVLLFTYLLHRPPVFAGGVAVWPDVQTLLA